jgi:hypothetical protein
MTETAFRVVVTGFCGGTADPEVNAKEIESVLKHYGFEGVTVTSMDDALIEALEFYADPEAWNQPPIKTIAHELLGTAYENQASKVRADRGKIARAAIAKAKGSE